MQRKYAVYYISHFIHFICKDSLLCLFLFTFHNVGEEFYYILLPFHFRYHATETLIYNILKTQFPSYRKKNNPYHIYNTHLFA